MFGLLDLYPDLFIFTIQSVGPRLEFLKRLKLTVVVLPL